MQGGDTHKYQVPLSAGQYLKVLVDQRGVDVVVAALGPDGVKISEVDSPNGTQGPEPVSIAAGASGVYQIEVRSLEANAAPGRYEIRIEEQLSAEQYRKRLADERARDEAVVARLRSQAIRLRSLTAGSGFADLMPLKEILRDVRVVGLGEATHGTREFFQVRHRLLEFLVREMGFSVVAVEGSYAAFLKINDYVLHGKGNRAEVLAGQKYWILDTEEVAAMIDWLRAHNQTVPDEKKVKFFGIDANANELAMRAVADYLAKVAPERAAGAEALFQRIRPEDIKAINFAPTQVATAELSELYRLMSYLLLNQATFVRQTSAGEFESALQHLRLIAQFAEFNGPNAVDGGGTRDGYMAENFQYLVNGEKPGTRFVVLAHNAHVSKRDTGNFPAMGSYLRRAFGNGYYAFGFAFNQGEFQAQVSGEGSPRVQVFRIGPAPERTVDWYLARAGVGNYVVDLRRSSKDEAVSQWLQATHRMHWVGAIFSERWGEPQRTQPFVLGRDFDGLVFIETTTRARPTPTGRRGG
ncbi:MAG TPA: erythromycin esterase family protein [Pyrinomonadaceae bacterium]|nr:erythromycin esterase family protein [Pyrinomonadaceae bacterium]